MKKNQEVSKVHFIGIGGIGVSALARYFLAKGFLVSGSDISKSEITDELSDLGAKIIIGHRAQTLTKLNLASSDLVVYSAAVQEINPELKAARKLGIKCQTYAQALGKLTKKYFTIAVSGTHGKSTTTAMIGLILETAGLDPTVIIGTKVKWTNGEFNNFRNGKAKYLVIEADEYTSSFLNYWPKIIVLTNIEEDHLDFYTGGLPQIIKTFGEYVGHLGPEGVLVANEKDDNISKIKDQKSKSKCKIKNYDPDIKIKGLKLKIPGVHNLSNAAAAITVARLLNIPDEISVKTLNNFTGTWRRMEYKGEINGAKIYDDYAHHPTEINATLQGARELLDRSSNPRATLWCVFQPHQYQRTFQLFGQFVKSFVDADKVVLLPIYSVSGREKAAIKRKVSSIKLAQAIKARSNKNILYLPDFKKTKLYLEKNLKKGDVAIIMGAGTVNKLTKLLFGQKIH